MNTIDIGFEEMQEIIEDVMRDIAILNGLKNHYKIGIVQRILIRLDMKRSITRVLILLAKLDEMIETEYYVPPMDFKAYESIILKALGLQ